MAAAVKITCDDIMLISNQLCLVVRAACKRDPWEAMCYKAMRPRATALCNDEIWLLGAPGSQHGQRAPQGLLTPTAHAFQHIRQLTSG